MLSIYDCFTWQFQNGMMTAGCVQYFTIPCLYSQCTDSRVYKKPSCGLVDDISLTFHHWHWCCFLRQYVFSWNASQAYERCKLPKPSVLGLFSVILEFGLKSFLLPVPLCSAFRTSLFCLSFFFFCLCGMGEVCPNPNCVFVCTPTPMWSFRLTFLEGCCITWERDSDSDSDSDSDVIAVSAQTIWFVPSKPVILNGGALSQSNTITEEFVEVLGATTSSSVRRVFVEFREQGVISHCSFELFCCFNNSVFGNTLWKYVSPLT